MSNSTLFDMMSHSLRLSLQKIRREWRAGEHLVLIMALLIAVTALTTVSFFTNRVERAMKQRGNEILAADLRIRSTRPLPEAYLQQAQSLGLQTAETQSFNSVIVNNDATSLSTIYAISAHYPLRGKLKVADTYNGNVYETTNIPARGEIWVDARLLLRLAAHLGDELNVGKAKFHVTKILDSRPDQGSQFVEFAPTVMMRMEDIQSTGLLGEGSRIRYVQLYAGDEASINQFHDWWNQQPNENQRLETLTDASPQVQNSIERAAKFLNLTALTSVLLSGIGVAMAARRYTARHLDTVALMKTLGSSQGMVLAISTVELMILALIAGLIGTLLGYCAQWGLAYAARDLIRSDLPPPDFTPALLGMITPLIVLAGFALPPLLQLKRVPPMRVLRNTASPPPLRYYTVYGIAIAALCALLITLVRDTKLVFFVAMGTIATILVLASAGWLLVRSLKGVRGRVGVSWRYGVANIARRGRESIVQLVAFGLGIMVLLLLLVVRNDVLNDWRKSLPPNAPNQFLVNISPDRAAAVKQFFVDHGFTAPELVPMMRARLVKINDTPSQDLKPKNDQGRGFLDREANLSWSHDLPDGNKLIQGEWWNDNDKADVPRISVEKSIAQSFDLKLGDTMTYDVGGQEITATVSSIREVRWDSFKPNFFVMFSPGVLDKVIGTYISSVHIDPSQRGIMSEFYQRFPEVSAIDIDALITQIRNVMDSATLAIQYVFLFSLLAGIAVLLAAIQATRDERRYESAMLRTLGATRRVVLQSVAAEFTVLGLLAGILGAAAASAVGYHLATRAFNLNYHFDFNVWWIGLLGGMLLVGLTGILVTRSVVNVPPALSLRER